jgi:uracil-DNA glycosylase family 4
MSDAKTIRDELLELTRDVAEQVAFLRELGVENFDVQNSSTTHANVTASVQKSKSASFLNSARAASDAFASSALARNAVFDETSAPHQSVNEQTKQESETQNGNNSKLVNKSVSPATAGGSQHDAHTDAVANEVDHTFSSTNPQNGMAKRKVKTPSPTPLPEETLFGIITPADAESLPRANETLEDIRRDIGDCHRCPLWEGRTQIVNSEGNPRARLMFVGEAPGADEDASGHPFVGRAGQLLNKIIEAIGLKREDVFIGNINRCRPPGNRTPTALEAATCKPFLLREIAVVRPEIIVVLGNTAMKNLLDTKEGITKLRGQFLDYKGIKVMPTFHPAYLLRDPSKKREVWEDMKKVRDYLNAHNQAKG